MHPYEILMSQITLEKILKYKEELQRNGIERAGAYFQKRLKDSGLSLEALTVAQFTDLLIQTKLPKIFAESAVKHDGSDWTLAEESILGDISVHMPVEIYNDGGHYNSFKSFQSKQTGHLAYVPGALLQTGGDLTADMKEVVTADDHLDQAKLNALYERRLLPQLLQINAQAAASDGKKAAVTMPGIGTGQFAGAFWKIIKRAFREALMYVLTQHHEKLPHIEVVHYDPYEGDVLAEHTIGHINLRICPLTSPTDQAISQLNYPAGTSAETHLLTSFVAWDHFSWPGNDFWAGSRATDDGVKAASTDTMYKVTGIKGSYLSAMGAYLPRGYQTWQELAADKRITFSGPIYVMTHAGEKRPLSEAATLAMAAESASASGTDTPAYVGGGQGSSNPPAISRDGEESPQAATTPTASGASIATTSGLPPTPPAPPSPDRSEALRQEFLTLHAEHQRNNCTGTMFTLTGIKQDMTWQQIIDHARGHNTQCMFFHTGRRSLDILIKMNILDANKNFVADSDSARHIQTIVEPNQTSQVESSLV